MQLGKHHNEHIRCPGTGLKMDGLKYQPILNFQKKKIIRL